MKKINCIARHQKTLLFLMSCAFSSPSHALNPLNWIKETLGYSLPKGAIHKRKLYLKSNTEIVDSKQKTLAYLNSQKNVIFKSIDEISPHLISFVVLSEDAKFFQHQGIDTKEIKKSIKDFAFKNKKLRGASTITQQLAKNLFLNKKRSFTRKAVEVAWTKKLENSFSKKTLLESYLNIIEWGPCLNGAEAASRHFFDKRAEELSPAEAISLTMMIPNPVRFDLHINGNKEFIRQKRKTFVERLHREKLIGTEEMDRWTKATIKVAAAHPRRTFPKVHCAAYSKTKNLLPGFLIEYLKKIPSRQKIKTTLEKEIQEDFLDWPIVKDFQQKKDLAYLKNDSNKIIAIREIPHGWRILNDEIKDKILHYAEAVKFNEKDLLTIAP